MSVVKIWFSEKEVSELTGMSLSSLQKNRFYQRGIPYSKINRSVRYKLDDIMEFMEKCRINFPEKCKNVA